MTSYILSPTRTGHSLRVILSLAGASWFVLYGVVKIALAVFA